MYKELFLSDITKNIWALRRFFAVGKRVFVKLGLLSIFSPTLPQLLRPEEVEMLVCGNPDFDMRALSKVTIYDGFSKRDATVRYRSVFFVNGFQIFCSRLQRSCVDFSTPRFVYLSILDIFGKS